MTVHSDAPAETLETIKYVRLISPPPDGAETPWFTAIDRDGFQVLWEAVTRLELMLHRGKTSDEVGGPYLLEPSGSRPGGEAVMVKNPPPPPPPFHG
jgi:hypothetical protein